MQLHVTPSPARESVVTVPGDKSISHRALMLGAIADGQTTVSGFLAGEDCLATLDAMRMLGIDVERHGENELTVHGKGLHGLTAPDGPLDMGNSGTAMRLMAGLLAGQRFRSQLVGDASLTGRPMGRIIKPLSMMGARVESDAGMPPLSIHGGKLTAIDYTLPMASAQVKSAILLAGLYGDGITRVREPAVTRDHTERMLRSMGAVVRNEDGVISLEPGQPLQGGEVRVPGDLSSAAFVILAALLADDADILIQDVGVNPTRTGVIDILLAMGADISMQNRRDFGAEPVADIRVRSSQLQGVAVDPALVSLAIDEFPVLFVAAASASGQTVFSDIGELRVKESDRIAAMASGIRALGVKVNESPDGAVVYGGQFSGGVVQSRGDHRVAMSLAVAGSVAADTVIVDDAKAVDTSFPGFTGCMAQLGLDVVMTGSGV